MLLFLLIQQLIISEVMYNPSGSEFHNEFIEIYNAGDSSIDLAQYQISDGTGTDALIYFSGNLLLEPKKYAILLDGSYPQNSTHYNSLIPSGTTVYIVNDNAIGSGGLSNSKNETISIYKVNLIDSITYKLGAPNGFSYEKNIETKKWSFSHSENGSPGVKQTIENTVYKMNYNYKENIITFQLTNTSRAETILKSTITFNSIKNNMYSKYNELNVEEVVHFVNSNTIHNISIENKLHYGYTQLHITTNNKTDTLNIFVRDKYFPIHISKIKLAKPQWLQFTNYSDYDYLLDTIKLKTSNSWKNIPINKVLKKNESIRLSKHNTMEEIFNPDIPYLYSTNVTLNMGIFHQKDSISYSTSEIPFYETEHTITISELYNFNKQSEWVVDRFSKVKERSFQLSIRNNPFSPKENQKLEIELNYNEYDLIHLKIYDFDGFEQYRFQEAATYFGINTWKWDGKNNSGSLCKSGAYILLFKGRKNGKWTYKKYPIALYNK